MLTDFIKIYNRDLDKLKTEIEVFHQEENLWRTTGKVKNPAGNLCLHLMGNLNTYIGKNLGNSAYIRNREAEFALQHVPRPELIRQIIETREIITSTLGKMKDEQLSTIYPENVLGYEMTTGFFLIHLAAHLSWHAGQINYLRRILE